MSKPATKTPTSLWVVVLVDKSSNFILHHLCVCATEAAAEKMIDTMMEGQEDAPCLVQMVEVPTQHALLKAVEEGRFTVDVGVVVVPRTDSSLN